MSDYKSEFEKHESFEQCKEARSIAVHNLLKSHHDAAHEVGVALGRCRKARRCCSGACPVCGRAWRLRVLPQAESLLGPEAQWTRFSCLPLGAAVTSDDLLAFDVERFIERQERAVRRAFPDALAIGGFELTYCPGDAAGPRWHLRSSIAVSSSAATYERFLGASCPDQEYSSCRRTSPARAA